MEHKKCLVETRHHVKGARKGFTLAELLISIVIIVILAGGLMALLGAAPKRANEASALKSLKNITTALESYFTVEFDFPGSLADLKGEYLPTTAFRDIDGNDTNTIYDPWQQQYTYVNNYVVADADGEVYVYCEPDPSGANQTTVTVGGDSVTCRTTKKGKPLIEVLSE